MFRGQPKDMSEHDDESEAAKRSVIQNILVFCVTVAIIRAAPLLIERLS